MVDGNYVIQIDTPFGKKPGTVVLHAEGDVVHANIDASIVGKQSTDCKLDDNEFTADGTFKVKLVGKVTYSLRGEVSGDDLHIVINSSKGDFVLDGVRA